METIHKETDNYLHLGAGLTVSVGLLIRSGCCDGHLYQSQCVSV